MSTQSIQSQDIKIAEVFQGFYSVPDYQREYVWQSEQVEQLLTDIHGELNGADPEKAPEYFIGSIVVSNDVVTHADASFFFATEARGFGFTAACLPCLAW